ncbi:alpha/beta fold hydrolase [Maritimibacter sp. DP1N21-5]|uniref:alpha/beta fold hydrolase n=1 Tax=Maritimibacter sp. DP1N21-5 TaxID=2836867 RepID=UPI001C45D7FE|nr:alpha/beta hydrolase [Maritimibacter sp. DP1N21-5]
MSETIATEIIAGFPTHVTRAGGGQRRALFIHCSLAHSGAWLGVMSAFLDKLSMTAFDRPGHGRSGPWQGQDAAALLAKTSEIAGALIDRRADVIGHSWGATVALRLAMEWPEHVRSVVLIEPVLYALIKDRPAYGPVAELNAKMRELVEAGDRMGAARLFNDVTNAAQPFDRMPPERQARLAAQIGLIPTESPANTVDAEGIFAPERLARVKQPVLLLESANPPVGLREVHEVICAAIPQTQRVVIAGAGHMAPITHPDNVAGEIAAFLKL